MFNNLNSIKTEKNEDLKRWQEPDEMFKRVKTHIVLEMINSTNTFDDIKYKLKKINYLAINEPIKADFNIALIGKEIYTIISNDVNDSNIKYNYEKIDAIIKEYNAKKEHIPLIQHLLLTFRDCLNIFLYQKDDPDNRFKNKLIEFLYNIYDKMNDDITSNIKKDYFAAMLLLVYNLERFLYLKEVRAFR